MPPTARLAVGFAALGHLLHHVLTGLYLTLVVVLQRAWERPYDELIGLWTLGAFLIGAGAPAAGWLADRVGHAPMMAAFFLGAGAATVAAGFADAPAQITLALAALGLFAAIYHPVGIAWALHATPEAARGRVMGFVGVAGSVGVAAAALVAGGLAELAGWRAALWVPGGVAVAAGVALLAALPVLRGAAPRGDAAPTAAAAPPPAAGAPAGRTSPRVLAVLAVTLSLGSVLYGAFTTAAPKWLDEALGGTDPARLGLVVALVFLLGGTAQLAGGWLADRVAARTLYALTFAAKLPLLLLAGALGGWPAVAVAALVAFTLDLGGPVENLLLARHSPGRRQGLAFGIKYAVGFAAAPIGVAMVAALYGLGGGGFLPLFLVIAALTAAMLAAAWMLPADRPAIATTRPAPAAAE